MEYKRSLAGTSLLKIEKVVELFRQNLIELAEAEGEITKIASFAGSISVVFGEGNKRIGYWVRMDKQAKIILDQL
jgi:hypothetical protein